MLSKGQAGLSVAFDLPTQIGMDSDHALALGEVGKVGVAIDSLEDMETLFNGIPLEKVSTSMTINATAAILLCLYVAVARKQGANPAKISGTAERRLKEYIAHGTYIYPVRLAMRIVMDISRGAARICLSEYIYFRPSYPRSGSTAGQEVAFTLLMGRAY